MPFQVGPMELVVVLVIALLILGPKRLPAAGRSLGRGITEFKSGISGRGEPAAIAAQPAAPAPPDSTQGAAPPEPAAAQNDTETRSSG